MQVQSLGQEDPLEKQMASWYSCLENPMDRGSWWSTVHRVAKSWTRPKRPSTHVQWTYLQGRNRDANRERTRGHGGEGEGGRNGGRGWEELREWHRHIDTIVCKTGASETLLNSTGSSARCYDDLEGWTELVVGGSLGKEGIYVCMELIHAVVQQKLTQRCKAIALQVNRIIF